MNNISKPKFIFVNPPTPEKGVVVIRDLDRSGRKTRERTIWPQTSLAYLAAVMAPQFDVEIMDCIAEEILWEKFGGDFERRIQDKKPKYILTNIVSSTLANDMKAAEIGKLAGSVTIGVGPHVTALSEESLRNFPFLDFVILGEAEETLKELVEVLETKGDLSRVRGITWRRNKEIIINERRPLIKDLDSLPIPLHELLPIKKYSLPFIGSNYTFVMSDRGCPFQCTFCRSPIVWNRIYRSRSAESIIGELEYLKNIGIRNFAFHSDNFTLDKEKTIKVCQAIVEKKLSMHWVCNSRIDTVDEELLNWLKRAGCHMIAYGIESGSQKILDNVKKRITVEQIKNAVYTAHKAELKVWGYFIFGLPGETSETVRETIDLAKELPLTLANFAVGAPYPGTDFYNLVKERGWLISENWEDYDQNYSVIVSYPEMTSKQIEKAMKMAYKEWYFRLRVILNVLREIKNWNDVKILIDVAWGHLKWMVK